MSESKSIFQLVVVGSSAGGIEALSKLVASLPSSFAVPLVIAQHLDPKRMSHLAEILVRHTSLPVISVERQELLKPGTIYVVPANHHVEITDHDVTLLPDGDGRPTPSINLLLTTAAEIYNEKLIAVILTGTGTDGTEGARIVHERGGTVIIQNPETAAYPGMPESLAPETVDFVINLPEIGTLLVDLLSGKSPILSPVTATPDLVPFLTQVLEHTGINFGTYKPATLLRRVQRRIVATASGNISGYKTYLDTHPDEYELLVADFLIKVTEFMRDPELFTYLRTELLPKLIEYSRQHNKELRFWSAGCATGEEAYSLAILLSELLGSELEHFNIKIFATDLDSDAISFARRGFYSPKSLEKLSPELMERYFISNTTGTGYDIKKQVRNLVIFGEQDLGQRAPFPRIDLVLCRNVLIYFNRKMQEHVLQLFAFALRDEGYLVLGRTETVNPLAEFFDVQELQQRVYLRQGVRRLIPPLGLKHVKFVPLPKLSSDQKPRMPVGLFQMQEEAHQNRLTRDNLLLNLPVGVVVVDSHFDILEINAAARRLLSIHTIGIGEDFVHIAQSVPPRELGAAITRAIRENSGSTMDPVEVPHLTTGEATFLQISCYPQPEAATTNNTTNKQVLIIIVDQTLEVTAQRKLKQDNIQQAELVAELNQRIQQLEGANLELQKASSLLQQTNYEQAETNNNVQNHLKREVERISTELVTVKGQQLEIAKLHSHQMEGLVEANQLLLVANEEITSQNATLRADNEEYLMYNEEAQAAIEEVDTLNEEMQASNEELETLNEELQATVEELNTTNSDLVVQREALRKLTEELRIQHQLSEREKRQLEAILASMADALVVVDSNGKVLLTNAAYEKLLVKSVGLRFLDEDGDKPLLAEDAPLARAARGEAFNLTFNFRGSDNRRHWLEAICQPVRAKDMDDWGVVVMRDITERSLQYLQEQFLSVISHELRTPITVIKGYTQRAESWLNKQGEDNEKPLRYLSQALNQVATLQRLIDDLMNVSRLQSGKFNLIFKPVRLDTLFTQVVETGQLLTTKPLIIEPGSEAVPLWVRGDAIRLELVIINLITNSIIHAPTSPKINLSLKKVAGSEQAEIRVQDYGEGIKADQLTEVFDRFYQVMHGKPVTGSGLGLGLFISQQIVLAHGGTIRVESIEGEGTTFIVQLPLINAEELD